jgi:hypothetical protein
MDSFSPAAPIDRRDVLAGRVQELGALMEVLHQRGQHAVIYGERGVGKTSLATVAAEIARAEERCFAAHVICDSTDDYGSIWQKIFEEILILVEDEEADAARLLRADKALTPNEVRLGMRQLTANAPAIVFVDEFDKVTDSRPRQLMADTIKVLSDQAVRATVVPVGVASSVTDLIDHHPSIDRALVQVEMKRLPLAERRSIIDKGLSAAMMTIEPAPAERIALLSQGMPAVVHRLAQQAGLAAVATQSEVVTDAHVDAAVEIVVTDTNESASKAYHAAVYSARKDTLFADVLLACACAPVDERGFFKAAAAEAPLKHLTGQEYKVPAFARHLDAFQSEARSRVLVREGETRMRRYRFRDPLLQPYVLMQGMRQGRLTPADLRRFSAWGPARR